MSQPTIILGRFLLQSLLGCGGMGQVWRAVHTEQRMPVAIKILPAKHSAQEMVQRRFLHEVQALAGLNHPGIISVFDHGVVNQETADASHGCLDAGSLYLVMELAEGGALEEQPPLSNWAQLKWVLTAVLDALAYAHARGVIHRDIKPHNILISHNHEGDRSELRRLKLTDFGIAFAIDNQDALKDEHNRIAGSVRYMAPEQLLGWWRDQGPWTDLYGLGCMAYQLVTGVLPFGREGHSPREIANLHIRHQVPKPTCRFSTPAGFVPWLMKMLAKIPEKRFRCAADAAQALAILERDDPNQSGGVITSASPLGALLPNATFPRSWRRKSDAVNRALPPSIGLGLYSLRTTPVTSRRSERDLLWRTLHTLHTTRQTQLVIVRGESGVGKSRLVKWLCQRAHELGLALPIRAVHSQEQGPHTGLRGLVEEQLRSVGLDRDAVLERVKTLMRRRGVQEPYWWLSLAAIACPDPSSVTARSGQSAHSPRGGFRFRNDQERYQAIGFLIRELCREKPVIAWFDDAGWSADTLRFTRFMTQTRRAQDCPALFVLTVRSAANLTPTSALLLEQLSADPKTITLELPPLDTASQKMLVRGLLDLDATLADTVAKRTEGNPLFAVQLIGDWVHRRLLEPSPTGFKLIKDAQAPNSIEELWILRLQQHMASYPPHAWIALELAATLGHAVVDAEWQELCTLQSCAIPIRFVADLVRAHLAVQTDTGWTFVHSQLQTNLLKHAREHGRLATHHHLCAAMLRIRFGHSGQRGLLERMGNHLLHADNPADAAKAFIQAAEEHAFGGDFAWAEALWSRWQTCMKTLDLASSDPHWVRGALVHAQIQRRNGRYSEAVASLTECTQPTDDALLAEYLVELARATSAHAVVSENPNLFEEARAFNARAKTLYTRLNDIDGLAEAALAQAITAAMTQDWGEAKTAYQQALTHFQKLGDTLQHAIALVGIAEVDYQQDRLDEARTKGQTALAVFERFGARYYICQALYHLAELDRADHRPHDAISRYNRILTFMEGLGSFNIHLVRHALAQTLIVCAAFDEATLHLQTILNALGPHQGPAKMLQTVRCHALLCAAATADPSQIDALLAALPAMLDEEDAALVERAGRYTAKHDTTRALLLLQRAHDSFKHSNTLRAEMVEAFIHKLQNNVIEEA